MTGRREYHRVAWINLVLAAVATGGRYRRNDGRAGAEADPRGAPDTRHPQLLAFTSLGGIVLLAAWRYACADSSRNGRRPVPALSPRCGAIGGAGYFGGEMVYEHGAGVRTVDRFARNRYWKQVEEMYRNRPAALLTTMALQRPGRPRRALRTGVAVWSGHHPAGAVARWARRLAAVRAAQFKRRLKPLYFKASDLARALFAYSRPRWNRIPVARHRRG